MNELIEDTPELSPYLLAKKLLLDEYEVAEQKKRAWHQFISDRLNQKLLALVYKRRLKEIVR